MLLNFIDLLFFMSYQLRPLKLLNTCQLVLLRKLGSFIPEGARIGICETIKQRANEEKVHRVLGILMSWFKLINDSEKDSVSVRFSPRVAKVKRLLSIDQLGN